MSDEVSNLPKWKRCNHCGKPVNPNRSFLLIIVTFVAIVSVSAAIGVAFYIANMMPDAGRAAGLVAAPFAVSVMFVGLGVTAVLRRLNNRLNNPERANTRDWCHCVL